MSEPSSDWFERRVELSPDRIALLDPWGPASPPPGEPLTYAELLRSARRTARFLREACGVGRGDRVAVLARNHRAWLEVLLGCGMLGAVLQGLNWRLAGAELEPLLAEARPKVLLYGAEFAARVDELRASGAAPRHLVRIDALTTPATDDRDGSTREELLLSERERCGAGALDGPRPALTDPWILCYTGGSTGTPKAAVLTHGSVLWNAISTCASWGLGADDCAVLNAPMFHTGGMNVFTTPLLYLGGASVLCREFRAEQVLDLLSLPGPRPVSLLFGVPTMFQDLQAHPRFAEAGWQRLKLVISGGAPCPAPVFERFFQAGVPFRTGYGLTEAGPNNFFLPDGLAYKKPGSVGYPLLHVEAGLVTAVGEVAAADEVGELRLRGPHLCAGYFGRPEETAAALRDGWLHTGDLARRDADGCFYIVGRRKEMFISGGENVYPAEIESVLCGHPAVAEAAVLGVPDPRWGEVGLAVVALRSGEAAPEEELLARCHARLARYKAPRRFVFVAALPRTGAGKLDRQALRARHVAGPPEPAGSR